MKMSRRKLRESIFLLLFRIEFNTREELEEQAEAFYQQVEGEEDRLYIRKKLTSILDDLPSIDEKIHTSFALAGGFFITGPPGKPLCMLPLFLRSHYLTEKALVSAHP